MNIISKKKQGVIAIICAIAMIVTSLTIYNPREAKAADWSTVDTWDTITVNNIAYKVQKDGDFINDGIHTEGGGAWVNATNVLYMNFKHAAYSKVVINDVEYLSADHSKGTDEILRFEGAQIWISMDLFKLKNNTIVYYNGDTILGSVYVYNPEGTEAGTPAPDAPVLTVSDFNADTNSFTFTWDDVANASYYDLYVGDSKVAARVTSGVSMKYSELNLEQTSKDQIIKFVLKAVNGTGETSSEIVEKTLPKFTWKSIDNTDKYKYNSNTKVTIVNVQGKESKDAIYMYVTAGISSFSVNGKTEGVGVKEGAGCWIYLSALTEEENEVVISMDNNNNETVIIKKVGQTKYTVTVDGTATEVEEGAEYKFGDNLQGYYDTTNNVAYAPNTSIKVNGDLNIKSIKLNVAMAKGASIRLADPTGLRFQTVITSGNDLSLDEILNNGTVIKTGTIITTSTILGENGVVNDEFVKDDSKLKLDITNSGWYENTTGTFCGSIVKLNKVNYGTDFVGVGYVTIKYNNAEKTEKTIYASVETKGDNVRSASTVAKKVQKSDAYNNKYTQAQKDVVDAYAKEYTAN